MAAGSPRPRPTRRRVITLTGVNKWFGQFHVLSDINLDVKLGEKIVDLRAVGLGQVDPDPLHQPLTVPYGMPPGPGAQLISSSPCKRRSPQPAMTTRTRESSRRRAR